MWLELGVSFLALAMIALNVVLWKMQKQLDLQLRWMELEMEQKRIRGEA